MDIFRRGSWERKEKSDEDDKRVIASLRERIKDLELQLFDLKKKNEELEIENNQLKVWNTCENNDWLMKLTRHSSLSIGKSSTAGITDTSVDVSVMTSTATSDSSHHISRTTKINRQNTIIFTDKDTDFDSFKINKLDIQMKCQVGKGSFGVVWKGVYKESQVAVKLFVSEEIDIRSEVYAMSKVAGMQHVMDLIGTMLDPRVKFVSFTCHFRCCGGARRCFQASSSCTGDAFHVKWKFARHLLQEFAHFHVTIDQRNENKILSSSCERLVFFSDLDLCPHSIYFL